MSEEKKDAKYYFNKGYENHNKGNYEEAIKDFDESIRLDPNDALAYFNRGVSKGKLDRNEEAIKDFDETISLDTNNMLAYFNRGVAKGDLDRHEEAIDDYDEAIHLDPNYVSAYYNRGIAKGKLGRHEEAIDDYDEAIRLDLNITAAYGNRGNAKARLDRYEEAIDDYDEAIRLDSNDALGYYNRGNIKGKLDRHEEAIDDYDEAIRLDPNYVSAYYNRGVAKGNLGRHEEAIEDFNFFIRLADESLKEYIQKAKLQIKEFKKSFKGKAPTILISGEEPILSKTLWPYETLYKESRPEAVMFIDICGSTETMDTYGPDHFLKLLLVLENILKEKQRKYGCSFCKGLGDGFLVIFNNNINAASAAIEVLSDVKKHNEESKEESKINLRIGIAFGEIKIGHDDDRYGIPVNIASRIEGFQLEGLKKSSYNLSVDKQDFPTVDRIFVTHKVYKSIKDDLRFDCKEVVCAPLKGMDDVRYNIYMIDWKKSKTN